MKRQMKNSSNHPGRTAPGKNKLRQKIAVEAARLMSEEGVDTIQVAKKKAARKLGIHDEHALPDDDEILLQLKIHHSLYHPHTQAQLLRKLRETALNAMKLLNAFKPKLVGSVLSGYAHEHSGIDILIMADSPEEIAVFLMTHQIPYQLQDWQLYFSKHQRQSVPAYQFYTDKHPINLIVLSENLRKKRPLNPGNWQTMQRASLPQVEELLNC